MENTFIKYLKDQRKRFASTVSKYTVTDHRILRTEADSLLVAYDQAVDSLENQNIEFIELVEKLSEWGTLICEIYHTESSFYSLEYQWFLQKALESLKKDETLFCFNSQHQETTRPYELKLLVRDSGISGFVSKIKLPIYYNIGFSKSGDAISFSSDTSDETGRFSYRYIYSKTIDGLYRKAIDMSENNRNEQIENARKELKTTEA